MASAEETKSAILSLLRLHGREMESYQIAHIIGISKSTTNGYLVELESERKIVRRKESYYCYWRVTLSQKRFNLKRMLTKKWDGHLHSRLAVVFIG